MKQQKNVWKAVKFDEKAAKFDKPHFVHECSVAIVKNHVPLVHEGGLGDALLNNDWSSFLSISRDVRSKQVKNGNRMRWKEEEGSESRGRRKGIKSGEGLSKAYNAVGYSSRHILTLGRCELSINFVMSGRRFSVRNFFFC